MKFKVFVLILLSVFLTSTAYAGWKCERRRAWRNDCVFVDGYKDPTYEKLKELNEKGVAIIPSDQEKFEKQMKRWVEEKTNQPRTY